MQKKRNQYRVTYERDEGGWWIAELHGEPGVNSDGRTISDARRRVREALSLAVGDEAAEAAEFVDDIRFPPDVQEAVTTAAAAREQLEQLQDRAGKATSVAVRVLTKKLGLSARDIAKLLGISHQRVQQLQAAKQS